MHRVERSMERAEGDRLQGWAAAGPDGLARRGWWVLGDPQAPLRRVLEALDAAGLLGDHGRLRPEVGLLSVGDHFDYAEANGQTLADAAREGEALLAWLASHPPDQVCLLAGNHDLARVIELWDLSDQDWAEARALARAIHDGADPAPFHRRFPAVPTSDLARRDYSSFTASQRSLVQSLLLAGRLRLAASGRRGGTEVLITHSGYTHLEREVLDLPEGASPAAIADRLDGFLRRAVGEVAGRWASGERARLTLDPLSHTGSPGVEGGGFLHRRPALRGPHLDRDEPFRGRGARRFEPVELPIGLAQVAGHVGHGRCVKNLRPWVDPAAAESHPAVRTLTVRAEGGGAYRAGLADHHSEVATLHLVDPSYTAHDRVRFDWLVLDEVR